MQGTVLKSWPDGLEIRQKVKGACRVSRGQEGMMREERGERGDRERENERNCVPS